MTSDLDGWSLGRVSPIDGDGDGDETDPGFHFGSWDFMHAQHENDAPTICLHLCPLHQQNFGPLHIGMVKVGKLKELPGASGGTLHLGSK